MPYSIETTSPPLVSVIVRSYNRLDALGQLLPRLLAQRYPRFEVVVVEQSTRITAEQRARLDGLAVDPRLRLLYSEPLGGPRARNFGVAAARGDIILFIDDDDLPLGDGWIAAHVANYDDPLCLGVTGRHVLRAGEPSPYRLRDLARRRCMTFSPLLKMPWTYARIDQRKIPIEAVHGTNGSVRRQVIEQHGGWDEDTRIEDETSFCLRVLTGKQPGEYFAFDPAPVVQRGLDVPGGLDKRYVSAFGFFARFLEFVHVILGRYHRRRVIALYPLYLCVIFGWTVAWMVADSHRYSRQARWLPASFALLLAMPVLVMAQLWSGASAGSTGSGRGSRGSSPGPRPRSSAASGA